LLRGQQSGVTPNFTELYNEQSRHIAYGVSESLSRKVEGVEASAEAEAEWVRGINESARGNEAFSPDCTPGYCNNEGKPGAGPSWFGGTYGGDALASFQLLKEWREQGELRSLTLG
jgi:cyclohexanone monooxygenase